MTALALAGPTACGKSALAVTVARRLDAEIVSVDSGALYQDMNIGTATPTAQQQEGVPHHLINSIPPTDRYHVGRFTDDAVRIADDIRQRGKTPLFVGGTMMYFHALLNGLSPIPPISDSVWKSVSRDFVHRTPAELHNRLRTADPLSAGRIAANDRQRIHRALCVYLATGKPLSEWQNAPGKPFFRLNMIRLIPARRENLRAAISQRLRKMWEEGLLAETRHLLEHWRLPPEAPPLRMVGYRQAVSHLTGQINETVMREKAYYATTQLAKRQMTWLGRWQHFVAVDPFSTSASEIARLHRQADAALPSQ